jgi:hypothetical protein
VVEMKHRLVSRIKGLFATYNANVLLNVTTNETTFPIHDSVIVSTLVVKDHGESLLIKLPETTPWLAEIGNTLLPSITRVFPISFNSIRMNMQASNTRSNELSLS